MRKIIKLALLLMMMLAVRVELVFPQASVSTSEIRGQVTDPQGNAVAGATITVTETGKGTVFRIVLPAATQHQLHEQSLAN